MALLPPGGSRSISTKIASPGAPHLSDYIGTYTSAELRTDWRIVLQNGALSVVAAGNDGKLSALDPGDFSLNGMLIHFVRGPEGTVSEFTLTNVRDRNIRFERKR